MSLILHSYVHPFTSSQATVSRRNPIRSVGHCGQTICMNAECSIDGIEAAVEMTLEQAEQLVMDLRAEIFASCGRNV